MDVDTPRFRWLEQMFYTGDVSDTGSPGTSSPAEGTCPRCLELEDDLAALRRAGRLIARSPGPNPVADGEAELRRWLPAHSRADAAEGFRAGWARLARALRPRLQEDEARWRRLVRENEQLRARLGVLLGELERRRDHHS
jgi:hypothetical protein